MSVGRGTYHTLVLVQHLVVLAQRHEEHQRRDVLETVDPLLSLRALSADVEDLVRQLAYGQVSPVVSCSHGQGTHRS